MSLDTEAAAIASAFASRDALDDLAEILRQEHMLAENLALVWGAMLELHGEGRRVEVVTVAARLGKRCETLGGLRFLEDLAAAPYDPSPESVRGYAASIIDAWKLRRFRAVCHEVARQASSEVADVRAFIDEAEGRILAATTEASEDEDLHTLGEIMVERVREINREDGGPRKGLLTGLVDVDDLAGPMLPGSVVILGAHSGIGKTSLAMQIAGETARRGSGVYVASQEMTKDQLADRTLAGAAGMDTRSLAKGLSAQQLQTIQGIADRISGRPHALHAIVIDDRGAVRPDQLRQRVRRAARGMARRGFTLGIVIVDYVQLMDGTPEDTKRRHQSYEREVAWISKQLLQIARDLRCVVLALAQLNEEARTENRLPRGEDMSQCKALRHDAHRVILLHNEAALARRTQEQEDVDAPEAEMAPEPVQVIVDKNRGGREGMRHVYFLPSRSAFISMDRTDLREYIAQRKQARVAAKQHGRRRP